MQLPFLVVHDALIWKVLLAGFVALCVAAFLAIRYLLVRAGNRTEVRDLDTTDEGVIRGTLRGGTASTVYVTPKRGMTKQPSYHAGDLVIVTADGAVALDSEVRVAAGSRVAARRNDLPDGTPEELAKLYRDTSTSTIATAILHQVSAGDEVIAKGTLVREAGDQATDYRENATRRVLRGSIVIAARAPATKVVRPSLPILGVVIALSAFTGYKIESLCGEAWRETCRGGADLELANGNACVMANAMPGRGDALEVLLQQLDRATPSEATLQERILLSRLVEDCHASINRLERIDRPDLVLVEATRCADAEGQEVALAELGRFGEAAAVRAPLGGYRSEVRGRILVLAGAWAQAADYANERMTTALHAVPEEPDPDRRDRLSAEIVGWGCVGALMRYYAEASPANAARIRELAAGPHGEQCGAELAEIAGDAERNQVLARKSDLASPWRALEVERQLAGVGSMKNDGIAAMLLQGSDSLGMAYAPMIWATRLAPPLADTADIEARFDDATHRLAIAVWMRDLPAAHRFADLAIELGRDEHAGYDAQFTRLFHPMIDLYTAKTPLDVPLSPKRGDVALDESLASIWKFMTPRLQIRRGELVDGAAFVVSREMQTALAAAQHGDGAALAAILGDDGFTRPLDLVAVLPLVKTHREELVRALVWMPVSSQVVDFRFPFGTAQYYAERRTMFELAGDTENAKHADDVFQRYVAAFHDHRRLVALALLDQ